MLMHDVTSVKVLVSPRLELVFDNGLIGVIDVAQVINSFDGVFAPLMDDAFFRQVVVNPELGTIVWPNGADLCPDVLYAHAAGQQPLLEAPLA